MNIVDSSGWLEYFADGPNADFFAPSIENPQRLIVPALCIFEVYKKLLLETKDPELALELVGQMHQGKIVDLTASLALSAAQISYDLKLPMADSIVLATSRQEKATLWTQDSDFKGLPEIQYKEKRK
jgi:predicted nucleic acid-binding protein